LTQLRGLAEDEPEETQVDSIKRTCRRQTVAEESAEVGGSWWEVCGRENRKEDWNVALHSPPSYFSLPPASTYFSHNFHKLYDVISEAAASDLTSSHWADT